MLSTHGGQVDAGLPRLFVATANVRQLLVHSMASPGHERFKTSSSGLEKLFVDIPLALIWSFQAQAYYSPNYEPVLYSSRGDVDPLSTLPRSGFSAYSSHDARLAQLYAPLDII